MDREEAKAWINKTCGEGWLPLVDTVFDKLPPNITVTSTYQKWGALRFDIDPWDESCESLLEGIEDRSLETCEVCGEKGNEKEIDNWIHTRCKDH